MRGPPILEENKIHHSGFNINSQILSHIFIGLNYCHVFCLDVVFLHIPKSIGLCHFWIWFKQRGLEIWTFFCPTENHVSYGRNLMLRFRFPFPTSITFCITSFRGNTVKHFGAMFPWWTWIWPYIKTQISAGMDFILFWTAGRDLWDDHCWETLELLCRLPRFGHTFVWVSASFFLIISPKSKDA